MLVESPPSPESRERSVNPPLRTFKALFAAPYEKSLKTPSPLLPKTSQVKSNSKPKKQETKRKHRKSPTGHTRCRVAHQVRDRQGASFLEAFLDPGLWGFGALQGFRAVYRLRPEVRSSPKPRLALAGLDVVGVAKTGSGKTLAPCCAFSSEVTNLRHKFALEFRFLVCLWECHIR